MAYKSGRLGGLLMGSAACVGGFGLGILDKNTEIEDIQKANYLVPVTSPQTGIEKQVVGAYLAAETKRAENLASAYNFCVVRNAQTKDIAEMNASFLTYHGIDCDTVLDTAPDGLKAALHQIIGPKNEMK